VDAQNEPNQPGDPETNAAFDRLFGPDGTERDSHVAEVRRAIKERRPWWQDLYWTDLTPEVQEALVPLLLERRGRIHGPGPKNSPWEAVDAIVDWAFLSLDNKRTLLAQIP
jgi:hypothetical protein